MEDAEYVWGIVGHGCRMTDALCQRSLLTEDGNEALRGERRRDGTSDRAEKKNRAGFGNGAASCVTSNSDSGAPAQTEETTAELQSFSRRVSTARRTQVMQSLDSSSEWPSEATLSSTTRFVFSESDQTEDDASSEASSEGVVEAGLGKPSPAPFTTELPQSPEPHSDCGDQRGSTVESDQTGHCHRSPAYAGLTSVSATRAPTEGDLAFSRKCAELSGYVRPLLELLNGLKTGRYDKGLSTFQQSVAMDRLQRIAGILQKPHLGEKYLRTLLQLEMMLKVWFPQVASCNPNSIPLSQSSTASAQQRWHQNQLPVKKRRLSWSDSESQSPAPPNCKLFRDKEPEQSPSLTTSCTHPEDTVSRSQGPVISESEGGSCSDTQDCSVSSTTPTSDPCQSTGRQEAAVPLHSHNQVQGVNVVETKRRAGRKSLMSEKPST
ncbi:hypothetical protein MHYP_G00311640 [Metynnis hypsauchen]